MSGKGNKGSSSSNNGTRRRSSRRAAGAATGGAGTAAAPKRAKTVRRRNADPMGPKIKYEDLKEGKRYLAFLKDKYRRLTISGKFVGIYEPDDSVKTPSKKPYIILDECKYEAGDKFDAKKIYMFQPASKNGREEDKLVELGVERLDYINPRYPDRQIFLPSADWIFYPMPYTVAELTEIVPALASLPPNILNCIATAASSRFPNRI
jgi:hypothetical protein